MLPPSHRLTERLAVPAAAVAVLATLLAGFGRLFAVIGKIAAAVLAAFATYFPVEPLVVSFRGRLTAFTTRFVYAHAFFFISHDMAPVCLRYSNETTRP